MSQRGAVMDINEFERKIKTARTTVDMELIDKSIIDSLSPATTDKIKGFTNCIIVMEECAELQKALSKVLRGKPESRISLIEEMGDVLYGLRYLQKIYNISDNELIQSVNVKLDRQLERNKTDKKN